MANNIVSNYNKFSNEILNFSDISVVWNQSVHDLKIETLALVDKSLNERVHEESVSALHNSFILFECPVVNPWLINERLKFSKIV